MVDRPAAPCADKLLDPPVRERLEEKVDEHAHGGRELTLAGIDRVDRCTLGRESGQQRHEPACCEVITDQKARQQRDAEQLAGHATHFCGCDAIMYSITPPTTTAAVTRPTPPPET